MLFQIEDFALNISDCNVKFPGLKPVNEWKAYQLKDKPGEVEFSYFFLCLMFMCFRLPDKNTCN